MDLQLPQTQSFQEKILLSNILGCTVEEIVAAQVKANLDQINKFNSQRKRLKNGYPLDYLLGFVRFEGQKFKVTPDVLIPRPETEEWVQKLIQLITQNQEIQFLSHHELLNIGLNTIEIQPEIKIDLKHSLVLDVGCGSGIIGLTLAKYFSFVGLCDLSTKALDIAYENMQTLGINNAGLFEADLLDRVEVYQMVEDYQDNWYLVANLPYLPDGDSDLNHNTPLQYEPEMALYGGRFGLSQVSQMLNQLRTFASLPRVIFLELDPRNIFLARQHLSKIYTHTKIWLDGNGLNRVLVGYN